MLPKLAFNKLTSSRSALLALAEAPYQFTPDISTAYKFAFVNTAFGI